MGRAQHNIYPGLKEGQQYFREGDYGKAEISLEKVINAEPTNKEAYQLLIASYLRQKKAKEAIAASKNAIERFPKDNWIKWMMGEAYLIKEAYPDALRLFLEIQQANSFEKSKLPGQLSKTDLKQKIGGVYRMMGAEALRNEKLEQTTQYYLKAQKYLPGEVKSYIGLAYVYTQRKDWHQVINWADKGLEKFPDDTDLIKLKAQAYYNNNDNEGLLGEYRKLYNKNPEDVDIALAYAEILIVNKKVKEALPVYEALMEKYPKERRVYKALINVNEQFMNIKGKIAVLKKMRKQFPEDPGILKDKATAYASLENWADARKVYDTLSHIDTLDVWASKQIAKIYIHQDSLGQAGNIYKNLSARHPDNNSIMIAYGKLMEKVGDWSKALSLYKNVRDEQENEEVWARLGIVYEKLGKDQLAREAYSRALTQKSRDPMVFLHLGGLQLQNEHDEAFSLLEAAITSGLNRIESLQQTLMRFMQEDKGQLMDPVENQKMARKIEANTQITEDAIELLSENFEKQKVDKLLTRLVREYPASARLFYLAGNHYQSHRDYKEAISWYNQAIKKSPELLEAHLELGKTYEKTGQSTKAILAYERVLGLDESREEAYEALIRLYREEQKLEQLWQKWMARHRAKPQNEILKDRLIEALHKDGQYDLSKQIIKEQE